MFMRLLSERKGGVDQNDIVADPNDVFPRDATTGAFGEREESHRAGNDQSADPTGDGIQLQIAEEAETASVLHADDLLIAEI